ncbi:hypothetical protein CAPTEDRAFT_189278 [Capitella teleta]|uniref:Uncharacterized protein n=1 Tax=Capitella teleta TaxID=283909 RepID=R7UKM9_CAPTE|nr:hypothetical protein CAPTEDRAFT_189278 [Capitella teleta]|eukprot:ELU06643.1 hypothetical protein CAPTEDRAFT_189278 [Capitella teleta]
MTVTTKNRKTNVSRSVCRAVLPVETVPNKVIPLRRSDVPYGELLTGHSANSGKYKKVAPTLPAVLLNHHAEYHHQTPHQNTIHTNRNQTNKQWTHQGCQPQMATLDVAKTLCKIRQGFVDNYRESPAAKLSNLGATEMRFHRRISRLY